MSPDFVDNAEFEEFAKLFDETDQALFEEVRLKVSLEMDGGWGHNTIYNKLNFKNGTLEALERTRQKLSVDSAEHIIDTLYTLGYANKRILYVIWKLGYVNISFRDLRKYINQNKVKLENLADKFMAELNEKRAVLFQQKQQEVIDIETRTLNLYIRDIAKLQDELENTDITTLPAKHGRLVKSIELLQSKIDAMHGVTKKRDASIDIQKVIEIERQKKELVNMPAGPALEAPISHHERLV